MDEMERQIYETQIQAIQDTTKTLKEFNNEKELMDYIDYNEDAIYQKYCEVHPENITSDFTFENIPDVVEFVKDYMLGKEDNNGEQN